MHPPRPPARAPLYAHPAGVFFAAAMAVAVVLPWLWWLAPAEGMQAHLRLGLFGFGGAAVLGYVLTAARAWTEHRPPAPLWALAALWLTARLSEAVWPQLLLGLCVLWPVARARLVWRLPLAAVPLLMGLAEPALRSGQLAPADAAKAMSLLLLLVGGRAIPAFFNTEQGLTCKKPPLWPLVLGYGAALMGALGALALVGLVLARLRGFAKAGAANRMLALGWAGLAPALLGLFAPDLSGLEPIAAEHLLFTAAMGGTIFAFSARCTMRRQERGPLRPHPAHWLGFWLVLAAAPLRVWAVFAPNSPALALAGLCWSAGWGLALWLHCAALAKPAPFPILSAAR